MLQRGENMGWIVTGMVVLIAAIQIILHYYLEKHNRSELRVLHFRYLSLVIYGVGFLLGMSMGIDSGFLNISELGPMIWLLVLLVLIIGLVNYRLSKSLKHQTQYPQVHVRQWTYKLLVNNGISWILYLFFYEALFRGIFLFTSISSWGIVIAIILNVVVYSLAHIYKGKFEMIGAVPLGIVFCWITIYSQNIWPVFILHLTIALSNDMFCLWNNPKIEVRM